MPVSQEDRLAGTPQGQQGDLRRASRKTRPVKIPVQGRYTEHDRPSHFLGSETPLQ